MKLVTVVLFTFMLNMCYGQLDTVKVIMLYSDTALTELVGLDDFGEEYTVIGRDEYTYWKYGFVVKKFIPVNGAFDMSMPYWEDLCLLDADKKHIPKTNVVWQYKEIR